MSPTKMSLSQMSLLMSPFFQIEPILPKTVDTRHSSLSLWYIIEGKSVTHHSSLVTQFFLFRLLYPICHSSLVTHFFHIFIHFFSFVTHPSSHIFPPFRFCVFLCHLSLVTRHSIFPHSLSFCSSSLVTRFF